MHPPHEKHFDVIVIGAGPGGEGASMEATKQGKRVGVIERMSQIGGAVRIWERSPARRCEPPFIV
jgi:NAD(P) transhydrogenase